MEEKKLPVVAVPAESARAPSLAKKEAERGPRDGASGSQRKAGDVVMSRFFAAPPELVFAAWTKAEHLSKWFAPRPLRITKCELDLRPGGVFTFVMATPEGTEYPFVGSFLDVVPASRIVFTGRIHEGNDALTTVTFTAENGGTRLDVHQTYTFESPATRGAPEGWKRTLDQLGAEVTARSA